MAQQRVELILIPPPAPRSIGGVLFSVLFVVWGVWFFFFTVKRGIVVLVFGSFWLTVAIGIAGFLFFHDLLVRDSWLIGAGRLDRRRRILTHTWDSSFPGLKHFELVHGVWKDGKGSTDRLQFWTAARDKPVVVDATDNWSNGKHHAGVNFGNKAGANGQWSLKHQGLPTSPILTPSDKDLPSDPLADSVDENLLSLGVFLAKHTQRPLHFSQENLEPPSRGD